MTEQMTDIEWLEFRERGYELLAEHAADAGKPTSEEMSRTNADRCRRIAATLREHAELREQCDDYAVVLHDKYRTWSIYYSAMGDWIVSATGEGVPMGQRYVGRGPTMLDAMRAAAAYEPTVTVPPKPDPYHIDEYTVSRDGSYWSLFHRDRFLTRLRTKRACMSAAERDIEARKAYIQEWQRKYGNHETAQNSTVSENT